MFFLNVYQNSLRIYISALILVVLLAGVSVAEENEGTAPHTSERAVTSYSSQTPTLPDRITPGYIKEYFADTTRILASPVIWDGNDWLKAGLIIGATSGIFFADDNIKNFSQRNQSSVGNKSAAVMNIPGNPFYTTPALGLFYLYGHINEDPKARRTSLLAVESLAISGVFAWTVKTATQRPRPFTDETSTTWDGPGFKNSDSSFPSLHTTTAFSVASVFAEEYGNNRYVPPLAYGLATLTGLSRIYDNKHWASDVFCGAAIGYFVGKAVVSYHATPGGSALKIIPAISQQSFGLLAEYRF